MNHLGRFIVAVLAIAICGLQAAQAESLEERGRYIVEVIGACGNCHTFMTENGPDESRHLAGGNPIELPGIYAVPKNITPDAETGIGSWSDEEIVRAVREGIRPDGRILGPPMPYVLYRDISDGDMAAIVAYLRTVKPVNNVVEPSKYEIDLPPAWGPPVESVPEPDRDDPVAYGEYLAGPLGHCVECHSSPDANGLPDIENALGAGGFQIPGPWGVAVTRNITPTGIGHKSDEDIKHIITTGTWPDGTPMMPPMGYSYYANLTPDDLDDIVAYLRTLPPK